MNEERLQTIITSILTLFESRDYTIRSDELDRVIPSGQEPHLTSEEVQELVKTGVLIQKGSGMSITHYQLAPKYWDKGAKPHPSSTLKSLGQGSTEYITEYSPELLEAFENAFPNQNYEVFLDCPEFTALCPKTKQPDFGHIEIHYVPDTKLVESKSLKLYLFSFRNHGSFHEEVVNIIGRDLVALLQPRWLEVTGKFMPRGGISISALFHYETDSRSHTRQVGTYTP